MINGWPWFALLPGQGQPLSFRQVLLILPCRIPFGLILCRKGSSHG